LNLPLVDVGLSENLPVGNSKLISLRSVTAAMLLADKQHVITNTSTNIQILYSKGKLTTQANVSNYKLLNV